MGSREKLFAWGDAYDVEGTQQLFVDAAREHCAFHAAHCEAYGNVLQHMGFSPESLRTPQALAALPALPTVFFKKHEVYSMPRHRALIHATSSGTQGSMSHIAFEASGLWCGLHMVLRVARWRGLLSACPAHYIILGYQPHRGNHTAVTKTAYGATLFSPALSRTFALKYGENGYEPDMAGVVQAVLRYARARFPVRFMGFPSYTYFMLSQMREQGVRVQLPEGSLMMLGGGWKQFYTQRVEKEVLYELAQKVLGIPETHVVEFFGAVEHPILYCDCPRHHFHVPVYSRVIIRDVNTLQPVPNGQPGLVNLITPMVKATPVTSVITDDLGVLHNGEECGCGLRAPYLEILGRVGRKEIKTCAAGAAELLKGAAI